MNTSSTPQIKQVVKEYHPLFYKICRAYADDFDFDDLYQEVLINVWKGLKSFRQDSKLSTWMYRVALNTAMTYQRDKKRKHSHILSGIELDREAEVSDSSEKEERIKALYVALRKLTKDDRSIMLLYLDDRKYDEIAEITGLTKSNVGVRINRAKTKLRELLSHQS